MKTNSIWLLIAGLAVGVLLGREWPLSRNGSAGKGDSPSVTEPVAAVPTEIPAGWLKEDEFKATAKFAGLSAAQRYLVLKVMNEKPCDCGCPHGTTAACLKEDPNCPRAPAILKQAIASAKEGKNYDQILASVKKSDSPAAPAAPAPSQFQKVELAKWTPIEGPKLAKVTIIEFSDFQ